MPANIIAITATDDTAGDDIESTRRRTLDRLERCVERLARASFRDWRHCGKASCARSRRCRGFACEREEEEYA